MRGLRSVSEGQRLSGGGAPRPPRHSKSALAMRTSSRPAPRPSLRTYSATSFSACARAARGGEPHGDAARPRPRLQLQHVRPRRALAALWRRSGRECALGQNAWDTCSWRIWVPSSGRWIVYQRWPRWTRFNTRSDTARTTAPSTPARRSPALHATLPAGAAARGRRRRRRRVGPLWAARRARRRRGGPRRRQPGDALGAGGGQ